uniref:cobyric acid synthase n=1 Tax=Ilumatobacter nonamiensis TaxID=467093 RepID=UPI0019D3B7DC|nr:cobyric acid synthase [Ilumatobacter nonamiensis]
MKPLMVLGCTSDAGKSWIVTALCRWFAREGVRVAPFKAQNMSNNARVVAGGEIGVAQWLQAKAAGVEPDVRMNPVLLKPEADTQSQVVVRGVVDRELSTIPWEHRHDALWTPMAESFDDLRDEFDLVVIEGAGSPAEINLRDQVNNRMIQHADAAGLLVSDIDRGGSFAHLYGTWALVPDETRDRLRGFVLNRFRGDATLLAPGPERLTELTGMDFTGVVPMIDHQLPREEGADERSTATVGAPRVVIPRLPYGSNLDEFQLLSTVASIRWTAGPGAFDDLDPDRDLIVLPGSKHVIADLDWMRRCGLAEAVIGAVSRGVRCVGVCGGAMMLGRSIDDPTGVEGGRPARRDGLGLLGHDTVLRPSKSTVLTEVDALGGRFSGYEIRYGELTDGQRFISSGVVAATTVHGLFEHPEFVHRLLGVAVEPVLEQTFDLLADTIDEHLDVSALRASL